MPPHGPKNNYSRQKINREERISWYISLIKEGYTYEEIGNKHEEKYGKKVSKQAVHECVKRHIEKYREILQEETKDIVFIELERLNSLYKFAYSKVKKGDLKAIDYCLKIMERRSRLIGLDAPEKQEIENTGDINLKINWNLDEQDGKTED